MIGLLQQVLLAGLGMALALSAWRVGLREERFAPFVADASLKGEGEFEVYAYRTSARFGGRLRVRVASDQVEITGPRIGPWLYWGWLAGQSALLLGAVVCLFLAVVFWRAQMLLGTAALFAGSWALSALGAVAFWELANVVAFSAGSAGERVCFPLSSVQHVSVGPGWARRGIWLVVLPYYPLLDRLSRCVVSFEAPASPEGGRAVYALLAASAAEARALAAALARPCTCSVAGCL